MGGQGQLMSTRHIMMGLPASGKTTPARKIAGPTGAIRFTPDDWHLALFGQDLDHACHGPRHDRIEAIQRALAFDLLARGVAVVLHPCDAPLTQLAARARSRTDGFAVTLAMLTDWNAPCQPVTPKEATV